MITVHTSTVLEKLQVHVQVVELGKKSIRLTTHLCKRLRNHNERNRPIRKFVTRCTDTGTPTDQLQWVLRQDNMAVAGRLPVAQVACI